MKMTSPITTKERSFQREWLEELGTTIESLITNPTHKQRSFLTDLMPQYLKIIRLHVYPENEGRLKEAEKRLQLLTVR